MRKIKQFKLVERATGRIIQPGERINTYTLFDYENPVFVSALVDADGDEMIIVHSKEWTYDGLEIKTFNRECENYQVIEIGENQ